MKFEDLLKESGWSEFKPACFRKNNWILVFDTSSWIEVGSDNNPRIFDVPVPVAGKEQWTLKLIEHLCRTDEELETMRIQKKT